MTKGEFIWDGVIRQLPSWWFDMNTKKAPPSQPSSTVGENHDGDQTVGGIKGDLIWYQGQEYKGNTQNTMMKKTTPRNVVIVMAEDGRRVQPWERRLVFLVNISFVGTKKTSIMVNIFRAKCFKLSVNISYKMHQIVKRNTWYRAIDSRNESALLKFAWWSTMRLLLVTRMLIVKLLKMMVTCPWQAKQTVARTCEMLVSGLPSWKSNWMPDGRWWKDGPRT